MWARSDGKLDWTDVAATMDAVEQASGGVCTFTVSLMGASFQRKFQVDVVLMVPRFRASGQLLCVEHTTEFPNGAQKTLEGCLYAMILEVQKTLDLELAKLDAGSGASPA